MPSSIGIWATFHSTSTPLHRPPPVSALKHDKVPRDWSGVFIHIPSNLLNAPCQKQSFTKWVFALKMKNTFRITGRFDLSGRPHCATPPVSNIFLRPSMPDMASTFFRQSPTSEVRTWRRRQTVSLKGSIELTLGSDGLVPCPAWRPLSSQTWGWPSGPWSLCAWSPGGPSSSHPQTPSPSSGPASWTYLRDPALSASVHGSNIGKTVRHLKPGC